MKHTAIVDMIGRLLWWISIFLHFTTCWKINWIKIEGSSIKKISTKLLSRNHMGLQLNIFLVLGFLAIKQRWPALGPFHYGQRRKDWTKSSWELDTFLPLKFWSTIHMFTSNIKKWNNMFRMREKAHPQWEVRTLAKDLTNMMGKTMFLTCAEKFGQQMQD